jgi:co-chaperonin GroES (HSP10)
MGEYTIEDIRPVEYKALVLPDTVDDKSAGGLFLPDSTRERLEYAMDRGTLIAVGEGFFNQLPGPVPEVGSKIMFDKYKGALIGVEINGARRQVRLINDKDICAILGREKE